MGISLQVECYSGYTYAQEPRAFEWQGQRYAVKRILKRWRTPQGPAFRVEVTGLEARSPDDKAQVFTLVDLHYFEAEDKWTLSVQPNRC